MKKKKRSVERKMVNGELTLVKTMKDGSVRCVTNEMEKRLSLTRDEKKPLQKKLDKNWV